MLNGAPRPPHDVEANTKRENGNGKTHKGRSLSIIIEDFTPMWFTLSMNTGILSILMHQLPYQFDGLKIISTILFVFNLILFTVLFIVFVLRMILFPKALAKASTADVTELSMLGAIPIAWFTLAGQVGLTVSNASWGGHAFTLVAYVMWWIGTFVTVTVATLIIIVVSATDAVHSNTLGPALVLPFVATATDAVVGALIVTYSSSISARLAIPVIVVSYMLTGIGIWVAMLVYAAYLVHLMDQGLPPPARSPSLMLLVGPCGQTAAALLLLGAAARDHFGAYDKGTLLQASGGMIFAAAGVLLGLMFIGLGLFFTAFGVYTMLHVAFQRRHKYSLIWWSTIFPIATINTGWISLGSSMDSPTFRTLAAIFLIILVVDYIINMVFTLKHIWLGKLLSGKKQEEGTGKAS